MPRIARAMAIGKHQGQHAALSRHVGHPRRTCGTTSSSRKVKWMDNFFRKLGDEAKTDMFGKTPYYALNQMTKMGIRTGCGLPLRRAGPAGRPASPRRVAPTTSRASTSGFASATAGSRGARRSRIWTARRLPKLDAAEVQALARRGDAPLEPTRRRPSPTASCATLQAVMFTWDTGILKRADRLQEAAREDRGAGDGTSRTSRRRTPTNWCA